MNFFPLLTLKCSLHSPRKLSSIHSSVSHRQSQNSEREGESERDRGREREREWERQRERERGGEKERRREVPAGIGSHEPGLDITSQWCDCPEHSISLQTGQLSLVTQAPFHYLSCSLFYCVVEVHTHVLRTTLHSLTTAVLMYLSAAQCFRVYSHPSQKKTAITLLVASLITLLVACQLDLPGFPRHEPDSRGNCETHTLSPPPHPTIRRISFRRRAL